MMKLMTVPCQHSSRPPLEWSSERLSTLSMVIWFRVIIAWSVLMTLAESRTSGMWHTGFLISLLSCCNALWAQICFHQNVHHYFHRCEGWLKTLQQVANLFRTPQAARIWRLTDRCCDAVLSATGSITESYGLRCSELPRVCEFWAVAVANRVLRFEGRLLRYQVGQQGKW